MEAESVKKKLHGFLKGKCVEWANPDTLLPLQSPKPIFTR
jgi:hypothetical protein